MKNAHSGPFSQRQISRIFGTTVRSVFAAGILGLAATSTALADVQLTFGTYAADKPTATVKKYKHFLDHLSQEMTQILGEDVSIKMKIAKEYQTSIEQLANGDVDFSRFGPASYITVNEINPGVQIVAMEAKKGKKRFKGIIAVHADSEIQSLSELAKHSFAFGDELSTIGRYLAQSHLIFAGITSSELSGYEYLGRHDRVGAAVGVGKFTAGALKEGTFNDLVETGTPIKALFEFENVTKPWLASSEMEPRLLDALRQAILATSDNLVLESINKDGFLEGSDEDYDFIRKAMAHSGAF